MNINYSDAAFVAQAPLNTLSARSPIPSRREHYYSFRGHLGRPQLCLASSMGHTNESNLATSITPAQFNGQTISDSLHGNVLVSSTTSDVLSTQDIIIGTVLAFILAFGYSFLNAQSSSTSFVSWPSQVRDKKDDPIKNDNPRLESGEGEDDKVFNSENWKEMSREENYVLYNTKIRQNTNIDAAPTPDKKKENRLVLVALLVLFVPLFSIEFFFALSRQFICEIGMGQGDLVQKLCSPRPF